MKPRMSVILIGRPIPFCVGTHDINAYCKTASTAVDSRYQSEAQCQQEEDIARLNLARMDVPPEVMSACRSEGKAMRGGYKTVEDCINQKLSKESRLR